MIGVCHKSIVRQDDSISFWRAFNVDMLSTAVRKHIVSCTSQVKLLNHGKSVIHTSRMLQQTPRHDVDGEIEVTKSAGPKSIHTQSEASTVHANFAHNTSLTQKLEADIGILGFDIEEDHPFMKLLEPVPILSQKQLSGLSFLTNRSTSIRVIRQGDFTANVQS